MKIPVRKSDMIKIFLVAGMVLLFIFAMQWFEARLYPLKYMESVSDSCKEFSLEPALVLAIMKTESDFEPTAVSHMNAYGLMQLMPQTAEVGAKKLGMMPFSQSMLLVPKNNIRLGCWYYKSLLDQFGNRNIAIAAYNAGGSNVTDWLGKANVASMSDADFMQYLKFSETRIFVKRVLNHYNNYKKIYQGKLEV